MLDNSTKRASNKFWSLRLGSSRTLGQQITSKGAFTITSMLEYMYNS